MIAEQNWLYESLGSMAEAEFAICVGMKVVDERLVWRTACKDSVLVVVETDTRLDRLGGVLGTVIDRSDSTTSVEDMLSATVGQFYSFPGGRNLVVLSSQAFSSISSLVLWIQTGLRAYGGRCSRNALFCGRSWLFTVILKH